MTGSRWIMMTVIIALGAVGRGLAVESDIEVASAQAAESALTVEKLAEGFRFVEGPAEAADGLIYFSDVPAARIHRFDPTSGEVALFRANSGGANGLMFDGQGRLIACEGVARRVTRTEPDGSVTVLAESYLANRLNSPNDLVLDAVGGMYFTDPRYGKRDDLELDTEAVYYRQPDGTLRQIITTLKRPNGIALSPDGKVLYVADNAAQKVVAFEVVGAGHVADQRDFAMVPGDKPWKGPDGMCVDRAGRLYVAGPGGIWVFAADGRKMTLIEMPEDPANCTLAGSDRRWLYITARKSLYRVKLGEATE